MTTWKREFTRDELAKLLRDAINSYVEYLRNGQELEAAQASAVVEALEAFDYDDYLASRE